MVPTIGTAEKPSIVSSFVVLVFIARPPPLQVWTNTHSLSLWDFFPNFSFSLSHQVTQWVGLYPCQLHIHTGTPTVLCLLSASPRDPLPCLISLSLSYSVTEFNTTRLSYTSIPFYWPAFPNSHQQYFLFLIRHQIRFIFLGFGIDQSMNALFLHSCFSYPSATFFAHFQLY